MTDSVSPPYVSTLSTGPPTFPCTCCWRPVRREGGREGRREGRECSKRATHIVKQAAISHPSFPPSLPPSQASATRPPFLLVSTISLGKKLPLPSAMPTGGLSWAGGCCTASFRTRYVPLPPSLPPSLLLFLYLISIQPLTHDLALPSSLPPGSVLLAFHHLPPRPLKTAHSSSFFPSLPPLPPSLPPGLVLLPVHHLPPRPLELHCRPTRPSLVVVKALQTSQGTPSLPPSLPPSFGPYYAPALHAFL